MEDEINEKLDYKEIHELNEEIAKENEGALQE